MTKKELKMLSSRAHSLKPVVIIGNKGLTDAVQEEINLALEHHELIKIKIASGDKEDRDETIAKVCSQQNALLVKKIGHIFAIFRKKAV